MADYNRAPAQRFDFKGMVSVLPPDTMPGGKYPLAINARAYLGEALTPRLPQSANLLSASLPSLIHSLRRMDDTTTPPTTPATFGPNPCGTGTDSPAGGGAQPWATPGNITSQDGNYAAVTLQSSASAVTAGPNLPTLTSGDVGFSSNKWANPQNIKAQDGVYSTVIIPAGLGGPGSRFSSLLIGNGFGFAIPLAATIQGITLTVYRQADGFITDRGVFLVKAGVQAGTNHAGGVWGFAPNAQVYGSPTDLWGTTWTPADINNSNFGAQLQVEAPPADSDIEADVDAFKITVYYLVPSGSGLSDFLLGTNLGFILGGGVSVSGILVEIFGFQTHTQAQTLNVQLLKAGVPVGAPKIASLTLGVPAASLGSLTDTWGAAWLPADINNASFGVSIQAQNPLNTANDFNIDFVQITVYGFSSTPPVNFVYISGASDKVYVGAVQAAAGMSGKRLSMVPFRPNTSVAPWMYLGDSTKLIKIRSDGTAYQQGIKEPQVVPTVAASGAGPITGQIYYAYVYRSSKTGAQSNPSPTSHSAFFTAASNNISVTCTSSTDPQVDLIDVYRFGAGLLSYTYVTTILNSAPQFVDNLSDVTLAANPVLQLDNYEPFPSIDIPRTGILVVSAGALAGTVNLVWSFGDKFNIRWLGGTVIFVSQTGSTQSSSLLLFRRPSDPTHAIAQIQPIGATLPNGTYTYNIYQPILAAQPLPALWGPTDNAAFMFACGDPLRPGTLYFTKGNNPDSAPQTNSLELTSPAEPLIGGCIVGGLSLVMSSERGWLAYPNFSQATATILGILGSPFSTVPSITDRGLVCKEGICTDGAGTAGGGTAYFIAKDSIRRSPGGIGSESITDDLYNLFPHEGLAQQSYVLAGIVVPPPDYSQPDGMALRFSQGYLYFDYIGLDNSRNTLVCDVAHEAWSVDTYAAIASIHADNTGMFVAPGPSVPIGPVMGCVDGTVRQLSSSATEPNTLMTIATPSFDAGDQRATKHFGDLYLETTTPAGVVNDVLVALYADRYSNALSVLPGPGGGPPTVITVSNIDDVALDEGVISCPEPVPLPRPSGKAWQWEHDTGTTGTSCGNSSLVSSPAHSGVQARRFDFSSAGGGGERYHIYLGPGDLDTVANSFEYDVWVWITDLTHVNQVEFDMNQVDSSGKTIIFGVQADFVSGRWQVTSNSGGSHWNSSPATVSKWTANVWHHLLFKYHRDNSGNVTYDSVALDGVVQTINITLFSQFSLGWSPNGTLLMNFQMNGDGATFSTIGYLDEMTLRRSTIQGGGGNVPTPLAGTPSAFSLPAVSGIRVGSILDLNAGLGVYARDLALLITIAVNNIGTILHLWQPSTIDQPETTGARATDWADMGMAGAKFIQGAIIEADTDNLAKNFVVQSGDDLSVEQFAESSSGIAFNGRSKKAFSLAVPLIAHSVRLLPLDTVTWRVWGVEWVWVPYPELALEWHSESTGHGIDGYQHVYDLELTYISTADLTLSMVPDAGPVVTVVIPNSGGKQAKNLVRVPPLKFKLVAYHFTSAAPFRLWKEDIVVHVGAWGRADRYQVARPFGGESVAQAEV